MAGSLGDSVKLASSAQQREIGRLSCPFRRLEHNGTEAEHLPRLHGDVVAKFRFMSISIQCDMEPWWDRYRDSLASIGITLNELRGHVWVLPATTLPSSFPYAIRCPHEQPGLDTIYLRPYLTCGRDAEERDIVVKLVDKGSMEDKILRTLTEYPEMYDSSAFPNVLPPTAIIESPYEFNMVATPMWGSECNLLEIETVRDVLTFMRCTLTGLNFLHDKRIVHRDIHETNIATSWYCYSADSNHFSQSLRERRRADSVTYALYDFDCALQLPPETSLKDCRRPPMETTIGKPDYHPPDTWQGEVDYNPFAFDVACLGNLFVCYFANIVTTVPFLALLFAKMATLSAHERFSAAEALQFLREIEKGLTSDTLNSSVTVQEQRVYDLSDYPDLYWSQLDPELQRQWRSYRPPALSRVDRLLRRVCETATGWKFVMFVRRCLRAVFVL
ncbi:hypothetical protein PYCCODRAFT_1382512 [Trametes coccinea BRFM310]|uniref:Protein kinase domain-containing protein n=1 Tax=Trametes coccinea (strain BRFM310) TaxID=1353009 RepID=A0A1Y2IZW3_TRAC3|nr:hypothetical protein PYCCODRAFT_1382512 [Trametes coccinea BRFM310]